LIWKDGTTGEVNFIANIPNSPGTNTWEQRDIDISAAAGVNRIGIVTLSGNNGLTKYDLFTSDSKLHQFNNDLKVVNGEMYFLSRQNISENFPVKIKNSGKNNVLGSDYTISLMEAPNTLLASVNGVNLNSLEEVIININHSFSTIENSKRLYFKIDYAIDENLSDNTFREAAVSIVPNTVEINTVGELEQYLNIPFTANGNTNSLGEDDLVESMYYDDEFITSGGHAYGVAYKYDNILLGDNNVKHYPLKVWISQTNEENLQGGWTSNEDLILVYDGIVEILPGFNKDLYIPFSQPILLNGTENVVIRSYQYDPEWPPSIVRFIGDAQSSGMIRTIGALDVFNLDPENPPNDYFEAQSFSQVRFVIDPATSSTSLSGVVYNSATNNPITGATIQIEASSISAVTDINGAYTLPAMPFGLYNIIVNATGYLENISAVEFNTTSQTQDFFLDPLPEITVSGFVYGDNAPSTPLESVEITLTSNGEVVETISSDSSGNFIFPLVFGGSDYEVTLFLYGYEEKVINISAFNTNIDLGDIILTEEFISPFDVQVDGDNGPTLSWKSPKLSSKVKLQHDLNVESNGYSNEPNEDVWLGNYYLINEITTITSVEIQTSIYPGAEDFVTIDIIDLNSNEVIASSAPFLILQDQTQVIDIPNIVVHDPIFAALHWQNNPETTNFLSIDYSDVNIFNGALIRYPGQNPIFLSDLIGVQSSFLLRVNTLDDGTPITNNEIVTYNVYRGLANEFPDTTNWELLNNIPISDLSMVDMNMANIDANEHYRYAVETLYNNGQSEVTFSNEILGQQILSILDLEALAIQVSIFPNPASDIVNIRLENNLDVDSGIELYDALGKQIIINDTRNFTDGNITINTESIASGLYFLKIKINNTDIYKRFIKK